MTGFKVMYGPTACGLSNEIDEAVNLMFKAALDCWELQWKSGAINIQINVSSESQTLQVFDLETEEIVDDLHIEPCG